MNRFESRTNKIVSKIRAYLQEQGLSIAPTTKTATGNPMQRCIRALIYTQLSNQVKWAGIAPMLPQIDLLFFHYDQDRILSKTPAYFVDGVIGLKCGNRCIAKQMEALHGNIHTLERIGADHGGIDGFLKAFPPEELVAQLSKPEGKYKLGHIGYALAWEFLRALGVDAAKPDVHLRRTLGSARLHFCHETVVPERGVNPLLGKMAGAAGLSISALDDMLWLYCASGYGNICTAAPRCELCCVKTHCRYPRTKEKEEAGDAPAKLGKHDGN